MVDLELKDEVVLDKFQNNVIFCSRLLSNEFIFIIFYKNDPKKLK
jgi:hypothetical protein